MVKFVKTWGGQDLIFEISGHDFPQHCPPFVVTTTWLFLEIGDLTNLLRKSAFSMGRWDCYGLRWHQQALREAGPKVKLRLGALLEKLTDLDLAAFTTVTFGKGRLTLFMPSPGSLYRFSPDQKLKVKRCYAEWGYTE
jgi:hypothetical protein